MEKEARDSFENPEKRVSKLPSECTTIIVGGRAECRWCQVPLPLQRLRCTDGYQHRGA